MFRALRQQHANVGFADPHTLRLLEIMGRTDIPVMLGAAFPLVRTRDEALQWQAHYGKVSYARSWDERWWHAGSASAVH